MGSKAFLRSFISFMRVNIVSLAGLSVGMMVTVFSVTYIVFESSYDRFHKDSERIYQISTLMEPQPGNEIVMSSTHQQLKEYIDLHIPQIESTCQIRNSVDPIILNQDKYKTHIGLFVEREFFSVFDFRMLLGNESAIEEPNTIILSSNLAEKLFGDINCLGETLEIRQELYTIKGIIENPPGNSSIEFEYLIPLSNFFKTLPPTYNYLSVETYIKAVNEFEDYIFISELINKFFNAYDIKSKEMYSVKLGKLTEINQSFNKTSKNFILFITISALVLLVSIVNFVNTFAARNELKVRETGIRKVVGASRALLVRSMLLQSVLLSILAAILGLILSELFLESFRELSGINVEQYGPGLWWIQILILMIALLTGILAGIFPAMRYSSTNVISMIRGSGVLTGSAVSLRKVLIGFQYTISAGLLICIFIFFSQTRYLAKKDPGYTAENRMLIEISPALEFKYEAYISELKRIPGIISISGNGSSFGQTAGMGMRKDENGDGLFAMGYFIQDDFFSSYGIEVIDGKTFSQTSGIDTSNVIIDAATVEILGLENPIGTKIYTSSLKEIEIIGVVENTDLIALKGERKPFLYTQFYNICAELIIHYQGDAATIATEVADRIKEFDPEFGFNYRTVEEARTTLYKEETNQVKIVFLVGLIAVILTMIGAYSMAAFMAEHRAKQVSIRKVMGATVKEVLQLSIKEMLLMISIAFIIASPVSYYVSSRWLETFTQKISIGPIPFILAFFVLLSLVSITVFFKERNAAMANPVDNLRQE